MSREAAEAAAAAAESHWQAHFAAIEHPIAAVRAELAKHAAATGVGMGPQLDAAASFAVQAVVDHADTLTTAKAEKDAAQAAERDRDMIADTLPPPPAPTPAPMLATTDPNGIREWLKTATAEHVTDALSQVGEDNARVAWANQMLTWVREDGNTADVIEVLRAAQPLAAPEPAESSQPAAE